MHEKWGKSLIYIGDGVEDVGIIRADLLTPGFVLLHSFDACDGGWRFMV